MIARSKEPMVRETKPPRPESSSVHESVDDGSTDLLVVLDGAGSIREISPSVTHLLAHRRGQLLATSFWRCFTRMTRQPSSPYSAP